MANKSKPATMEEVNALHDEWWNSLTNEQKQKNQTYIKFWREFRG